MTNQHNSNRNQMLKSKVHVTRKINCSLRIADGENFTDHTLCLTEMK